VTVYVLHLTPPYRHARHYVGYTPDADAGRRVAEHLRGIGSPLVKAALAAGSAVSLAHEFPGAERDFERNLKDRKDVRCWCRMCGERRYAVPDPSRLTERFRRRKAW
jgi:predicted GIY-YIG superfamily endonuclease